jgi:hypothetical protein
MSATCRGCGKPIVWAVLVDGKKIPLDPRPPVYDQIGTAKDGSPMVQRARTCMVSHFATCPKASEFSGSRKEKAA